MAQCAPDITHRTCAQQAAYDTLHPHILPPLEPSLQLSFLSHTTTSDTSSEFTTYNHNSKMTTPAKDGFAVFEQDGNKCPILHHGELSAEIFHDFITGCQNYVTNKEITKNNQSIKVMTVLKGYIWEDWVSIHYDELRTLPLTEFLQCFKDAVTIPPYAYHIWTDPTFSLQTPDVTTTSFPSMTSPLHHYDLISYL